MIIESVTPLSHTERLLSLRFIQDDVDHAVLSQIYSLLWVVKNTLC